MGVDQTSLDRIRNATFPSSRRGYDKHEVEKFLSRLADWLETGGGDESRSETVKRELERVGERTGAILSQAEESAQQIRAEAEQEARATVNEANSAATATRQEAETYSAETRSAADAYAKETRADADADAADARAAAEQQARETIADAESKAARIVAEGTRRREDVEAVIADLAHRRDEVLADTEELAARLTGAVAEHRPERGADPFDRPDELDPEAREPAGSADAPSDDEGLEEDEPFDREEDEPLDEEGEVEPSEPASKRSRGGDDTAEAPARGGGRKRSRKVRS